MIKTTTWHPDTCDCIIEYTWDTEESEEVRTHDYKRVTRACAVHAGLVDGKKIHDEVKDENFRKNMVLHEVTSKHASLRNEILDDDGNVTGHVPNENAVGWRFDENRKLIVSIKGERLNSGQKKTLKDDVAKKFDSQKFDIE